MFLNYTLPKTFLGANSKNGFVSHFADCYSADDGWRAYIIKGGPGTGKSSMMKQLAALFAEGNSVELCPCSSDPDSLDAVIIHNLKTVIMDGTAPHTVEPAYPAVCETLVNLSDCWREETFYGKEKEILKLTRLNKKLHSRASRYISAAGELAEENRRIALEAVDTDKVKTFSEKLAARLIKGGENGGENIRFLSGITPKGLVFFKNTVNTLCDTVIAIEDDYGAVSGLMLSVLREKLRLLGTKFYTCLNPINTAVPDHIIIPSLSLAFCSENRLTHPDGITRRIHARRFTSSPDMSAKRSRLAFNKKATDALLREAVAVIAQAKSVHDQLEEHYIEAMDFSLVGALTEKIASEIKKRQC